MGRSDRAVARRVPVVKQNLSFIGVIYSVVVADYIYLPLDAWPERLTNPIVLLQPESEPRRSTATVCVGYQRMR